MQMQSSCWGIVLPLVTCSDTSVWTVPRLDPWRQLQIPSNVSMLLVSRGNFKIISFVRVGYFKSFLLTELHVSKGRQCAFVKPFGSTIEIRYATFDTVQVNMIESPTSFQLKHILLSHIKASATQIIIVRAISLQ